MTALERLAAHIDGNEIVRLGLVKFDDKIRVSYRFRQEDPNSIFKEAPTVDEAVELLCEELEI